MSSTSKRGRPFGSGHRWKVPTRTIRVPDTVTAEDVAALIESHCQLLEWVAELPEYAEGSVRQEAALRQRREVGELLAYSYAESHRLALGIGVELPELSREFMPPPSVV